MRTALFVLGVGTLAIIWAGPLPELARHRFSAHMTMHMGVVAVAAPLISLALARGRFDPARRLPMRLIAIPASLLELVIVWAWHTPAFHQFARGSATGLVAEQGMFLSCSLLVWMSACGGPPGQSGETAGAGVVALLLTSMHMTLLGALLALSPRPLYADILVVSGHMSLAEQQLGGAIMLLIGGVSYLAGGLWLAARLLHGPSYLTPRELG